MEGRGDSQKTKKERPDLDRVNSGQNMPARCDAGGCSKVRNVQEGKAFRAIPSQGDERPEARKRIKRWVDFVRQKRARWESSKTSVICSKYFVSDDFVCNYTCKKDQRIKNRSN